MTPFEIATLTMSGLGLVGGVIGFATARRARTKATESEGIAQAALHRSADARADAAASLSRSADSHADIAAALKEIAAGGPDLEPNHFVRIFEGALTARVEWVIEERAGAANSYRLRNVGNTAAEDVRIGTTAQEPAELLVGDSLGDLGAGQAAVFATSPRLTLSLTRLTVTWIEADTRQSMSTELNLP